MKKISVFKGFALGVLFAAVFFTLCEANKSAPRTSFGSAAANPQNDGSLLQNDITASRQNAITRAVAKVSPAVVSINVTQLQEYYTGNPFLDDPFWRQFFRYDRIMREVHGLGSGFLFTKEGYILTNQHVVNRAHSIVVTLSGGEKFDAELVGEDYKTDIAVLKIKGRDFPAAQLGNSDDLIIGEWVIAMGNPFGLFDIAARPTVTVGVISAVDMDFSGMVQDRLYEDMIQTDASINSGNSGGPLINAAGEVIGINTFIYTSGSTGSVGVGFAIPINRVRLIAADLIKYGSVQRDIWTQIQFDDITPMVAYYLRLPTTDGVIVTNVERNSPWQEAGLEAEDVILEIEGKAIRSKKDVEKLKTLLKPRKGEVITLKVYRNRRIYRAEVKF
ncbi:MAG: trypsin-like peptidase domain-containing protein [candidate division KSB1 bacterium]|nr:trypsin-like peptidase domain-containing protein [candidate division KSB1 bacterium]